MAPMKYSVGDWVNVSDSDGKRNLVEQEIVTEFAGAIDTGVYSFLNLFRDLGPYLTSGVDGVVLARALSLLPPVLSSLETEPSRQIVNTLVKYFCDRLASRDQDSSFRYGIYEVAASLRVIVNWQHFIPSDTAVVATAIYGLAGFSIMRDLAPATRVELLMVLDIIFRQRGLDLIKITGIASQINGLVELASYEKNPSCLTLLFSLYIHVSKEWDLEAPQFESLWNSFSRYYPITVGGSAKDPKQPSKETLRDLLLGCIVSNDSYAKDAIPMCLEKLDTTADLSADTKTEVLTTLATCVEKYSVSAVAPFAPKIWESLKFEIWNGEVDDFIKSSLKVLLSVSISLSRQVYDWEDTQNPLAIYINTVIKETSGRILDMSTQFLRSSGLILCSVASGSPLAFHLVAKSIIPRINVVWQNLKLGSERNLLLGVFNNLLIARLAQPDIAPRPTITPTSITVDENPYAIDNLKQGFSKFSDTLVDVYFGAVTLADDEAHLTTGHGASPDPVFGAAAIKGLTMLFQIPNYLSVAEQGMIVQKLTDFATHPSQNADIQAAVVESLNQISSIEPKIFGDVTLSTLVDTLPTKISEDPEKQEEEMETILLRLESLVGISCTNVCENEFRDGPPVGVAAGYWHRNFDSTMKKILVKLKAVVQHKGQMPYVVALLATILDGLEKFEKTLEEARSHAPQPASPIPSSGPYTYIVMELFRMTVEQKFDGDGQVYLGLKSTILEQGSEDKIVELVGKVAMIALRSKLTTASNNFVINWNSTFTKEPSVIWTLFTHSVDALLAQSHKNLLDGPPDKCLANALSMFLLAGSPSKSNAELRISAGDLASTMISNATSLKSRSSPFSRVAMLWMLQLLVNKFGASKETLEDGGSLLSVMKTVLGDNSTSAVQTVKAYQVLAYFTAASLASFDPTMTTLIGLMISGIKDVKHGRRVAQSFRILLDSSPILTEANYCTIRKLRKPRLFTLAAEPLITLWQDTPDKGLKDNYLIALAGVLFYMSPTYLTEGSTASRLMPLILEGVTVMDDDWTKVAYLKTLASITPLCPSLIQEHLDSVITRVSDRLRNTYDDPSDGSVQCRVLALEVMMLLIAHVKPSLLLQRATKMLRELDYAKDDAAWEVRQKATLCRIKWFYLADSS
ncbi:hypothetical protein LZ554_007824 [Drepanopeziza brunnea f. sp. 'monogermtubi']|nr:hypothetical protein LZ554_007824 [Drepanopeziza brunnea f. sp. 'monogermtubi']